VRTGTEIAVRTGTEIAMKTGTRNAMEVCDQQCVILFSLLLRNNVLHCCGLNWPMQVRPKDIV
jgi:hypothetical protein